MKALFFASRTAKEILRDPLNLFFGLVFPLILLVLLGTIQQNIPISLFEPKQLAPGIAVFGLSFMTLFSASLISKDRESAFLQRLYTTPLSARDFIFGYALPIIPISLAQCAICYIASSLFGLKADINTVYALLFIIPEALIFISLGLICGSVFNSKQVGGICGALLTNLCAWLSGVWFDMNLLGETFSKFAELLPFVHAVELERAVLKGSFDGILPHLLWVTGYAIVLSTAAVSVFVRQMRKR